MTKATKASISHLLAATLISFAGCDDSDSDTAPDAGDRAESSARAGGNANDAKDAGKKQADRGTTDNATSAAAGKSAEGARDAGGPRESDAAASDTPDADEQKITLRFQAQVGDEPFACGRNYAAQGSTSQSVTPRDLRMFIQDVALVDDKGKEVPVKLDTRDPWQTPEVALLDFEDASGECFGNADTNTEITGVVPKGQYTALRFSNGVPDKLNHSDPKKFPAPLKTPGMSWNWLLGLRFMRFETGTLTPDAQDSDAGAGDASFALHIGSTACAGNQNEGNITCSKPNRSKVELKDFDVEKSEIVLDVSQLLRSADLSKLVECHSASDACNAPFQALGLSYESGKPTDDQSAYRLK